MLAWRRDSRRVYTCNLGEERCSNVRNPCLTFTKIAVTEHLNARSFHQFTLKLVIGIPDETCLRQIKAVSRVTLGVLNHSRGLIMFPKSVAMLS